MILAFCVDDQGGLAFNHRRQSRDRALVVDLLAAVGATLSYRLWVWTGTAWYRFLRICVGIMCRWTIRRPLWRISPPAWKKRASTAALTAFGGIKRKIILSKIEYLLQKTPQTVPLRPLGVSFYIKQGTVPCFFHSAGDGSRFLGFTA